MNLFRKSLLLAISLLVLAGCTERPSTNNENAPSATVDGKNNLLRIKRYEKALFSLKQQDFASELKAIAPEYKVFLGKDYASPEALNQLSAFVGDAQNQEIYRECMTRFPELSAMESEFSDAFSRLSKAIPGFRTPSVYTYVSGFDFAYPIKYADSALIIALDMYLGSDYKGYPALGIPNYISQRLTPDHILPDCLKEMAYPYLKGNQAPTLLDAMTEEGKILWFAGLMLPETKENLIIGYSDPQLKWCEDNEYNIWSFLIENELLYSKDARSMSMFMSDGPFTASFSEESPARTGAWVGWQIMKAYAEKSGKGVAEIMAMTDSQEILEKSGYKPRK
ncbi:MAG: hypothetical protein JNL22_07960 [Bacteroidales bacterium]|nr:hypothetical protein [Bacteroidales bacterium]